MSKMTLAHAVERIAAAAEGQEIAVFQCSSPDVLECVFARTVETQRRLKADDPRLIGVFDGTQSRETLTQALRPYARATTLLAA